MSRHDRRSSCDVGFQEEAKLISSTEMRRSAVIEIPETKVPRSGLLTREPGAGEASKKVMKLRDQLLAHLDAKY
jgi:hypothetical protein